MGSFTSKLNPNAIDGLGYEVARQRVPTAESHDKLEQLLFALANTYEYNDFAPTLVSSYYLGASPSQLLTLFSEAVEYLVPWPEEQPLADSISGECLEENFGQPAYGLRYFQFFHDELTEAPKWPDIVYHYGPVIAHRLFTREMRPLIQLGCAVEVDNPITATEALGMACTFESDQQPVFKTPKSRDNGDFISMLRKATSLESAPDCASAISIESHTQALKELVLVSAQLPDKWLLVGSQALCEILLSKERLFPKSTENELVRLLALEVATRYVHAGSPDISSSLPTRTFDSATQPNDQAYCRACLFASQFLSQSSGLE